MDLLSEQPCQLGQVYLLARHAGFVGTHTDAHAAAHKQLRLFSLQGQCRARGHGRIQGGKVILQGHGYAAHRVIEYGDTVHVHGDIFINGLAHQQIGYSLHRQLAALRTAVAKAMGQADLQRPHAGAVAQHAQNGHRGHGVAVDLQPGEGLVRVVHHNQLQEVRLAAVAVTAARRIAVAVNAHEQNRCHVFALAIGHAVHLNGGFVAQSCLRVAPRLRLCVPGFQPSSGPVPHDQQHQHRKHSGDRFQDTAALVDRPPHTFTSIPSSWRGQGRVDAGDCVLHHRPFCSSSTLSTIS